jgi:iron complex outermembrane receptor protein
MNTTLRFTKRTLLALAIASAFPLHAMAQDATTAPEAEKTEKGQLETVIVTAQRRAENIKDVPMSIATVKGEKLDVLTSGGQDIRFLNGRSPSVAVESDYGRTFPRFYIRGLGNTDFDLNASQPVGLVMDDIVQENPMLKGFPVFDVDQVEVLRGRCDQVRLRQACVPPGRLPERRRRQGWHLQRGRRLQYAGQRHRGTALLGPEPAP